MVHRFFVPLVPIFIFRLLFLAFMPLRVRRAHCYAAIAFASFTKHRRFIQNSGSLPICQTPTTTSIECSRARCAAERFHAGLFNRFRIAAALSARQDHSNAVFRKVANVTGELKLGGLFDSPQFVSKHGDGVTIVPRAEAFGGAVQDLAQPLSYTVTAVDRHESGAEL
jgi:hypothetical protein